MKNKLGNLPKRLNNQLLPTYTASLICEKSNPLRGGDDERHSGVEERFFALGKTDRGKRLFIVFTLRDNQIRIISARSMSKKERSIYEKQEKNDSEIQK